MANKPLGGQIRRAFQDFTGGMNDTESALIIGANEFVNLENAVVNDRGLLEKAKGYITDGTPFTSTANSFARMLVNYMRGTSVDKLVVAAQDDANTNASYKVDLKATSGDGVYAYIGHTTGTATFTSGSPTVTGAGTAWTTHLKAGDKIGPNSTGTFYEIQSVGGVGTITLTSNYATGTLSGVAYTARIILHKDYIPMGITFNDNLVVTNGSEAPMSFNNTTLNLISDADAPKGKFIEAHKSRIFIASPSGAPSSVYWSAVNDETTWDAASVEPVFPKDGGNICAIKSFADSLIVLKDNGKLYQIVGNFDQDAVGTMDFLRKIDTPENMGVIAGRTAVVGNENRLYFLARSGWYALDSGMKVVKVSWNIENIVNSIVISPGPSQNKSYVWDTKTQWDTGTHSGTLADTNGTISTIFDSYAITDAFQGKEAVAVCIDSTNIIHVAYLLGSDQKIIKYSKWAADGTKTTETALSHTLAIDRLSMDVAANGNVGIMFRESTSSGISFVERVSGTWSAADATISGTWAQFQIKYKSTNVCYLAGLVTAGGALGMYVASRSGSSFSPTNQYGSFSTGADSSGLSLIFDASNNPYISATTNSSEVRTTYSTDGGVTLVAPYTSIATTAGYWPPDRAGMAVTAEGFNGLSDRLVVYGDSGSIIERNVTTSASRTLSSTSDQLVGYAISNDKRAWLQIGSTGTETLKFETSYTTGTAAFTNGNAVVTGTGTQWSTWLAVGDVIKRSTHADSVYGTVLTVDSDTQVTLTAVYAGGTSTGTYIARHSGSITNSSVSTASTTLYPGKQGFATNGTLIGIALFGNNANEILVRRISPFSVWTSAEQSDATLTAWSTYDATTVNTNGNTSFFQVALNTASPVVTYNTIVNGSLVSTDAASIYFRTKWYTTLAAWSASDIGAITVNYVGAGVDAKQPVGVFFKNEYYCAITESGQANNNRIVLLDNEEAWNTLSPDISCFCVYKNRLYAGLASGSTILKMANGYNHSGVAYTMTATSKEDLMGSLELEKEAYKAYVLYEVKSVGSFTFSYRLNNFTSDVEATWVPVTVDQTETGIAEIPITGRFKSLQFKIENAGLDEQVGIFGFVVVYGFLNIR